LAPGRPERHHHGADGYYVAFLGRLARFDLLILDDWGLVRLTATVLG